jgi:3-deoxy-D-arabino-heptulosonate 7-phosphate (DAHP) synthase
MTHLPIIVDPSHGTGRVAAVTPMARAAAATGVDGIMVEVHPDPSKALSDGPQALTFPMFEKLMRDVRPIVEVCGQKMS